MTTSVNVVIVGSIALDTIETPRARREEILGGSVSYGAAAASFFSPVGMVGVVGSDFPAEHLELFDHFGICRDGLQTAKGETFRWSGVYEENMNNRESLSTELNVFADFRPHLPVHYSKAPYVFLGNIEPKLQLHVLDQVSDARFTVADTMDLWINIAHDDLLEVISRVSMITINDSEAHMLTQKHSLIDAARWILERGPEYVIVKKGEHGAVLVSEHGVFMIPAYPVDDVVDPTGAGDSFAGGLIGTLAAHNDTSEPTIRKAMLNGTVVASHGVEDFSLDRLKALEDHHLEERAEALRKICHIP